MQNFSKKTICVRGYAKVNLTLDVTGVRENGYHDVAMVMQQIDLFDELSVSARNDDRTVLSFTETDIIKDASLSAGPDNLICKAAGRFFKYLRSKENGTSGSGKNASKNRTGTPDMNTADATDFSVMLAGGNYGADIVLTKNIPLEAGLAGGSTDAAATLIALNKLFEAGLSTEELCGIAAEIGADVPFCVLGGTALAEGIGEILTPLPAAPDCSLLIVKPPMGISTKFAYDNLVLDGSTIHPDNEGMIAAIKQGNLSLVCEKLSNVLESVSIKALPVIGEIRKTMIEKGAMGSLMCGSGSTVFGIFDDSKKARLALDYFRSDHSEFLSLVTSFRKPGSSN